MSIIEINYEEATEYIWQELAEYGKEQSPEAFEDFDEEEYDEKENVQIALAFEENDTILGRITGQIDYDNSCLRVEAFAVEKEARGKRIGSQLLKELENIAINEGISMSFVETISISAPDFYKKQGYSVLGSIEDYPTKGITNYWFYKRLKKL